MTAPIPISPLGSQYGPDYEALWGPGSARAQQVLTDFYAQRDSFYQPAMAAARVQPAAGGPSYDMLNQSSDAAVWHDEDLVGAARFWGIPEEVARGLPRQQLIDFVQSRRTDARAGESTIAKVLGSVAAVPAQFGVGAMEAITGGLEKLPIVGEYMAKFSVVHGADMWFRQLEEGIRASTPEGMQGLESVANVAGNLAATWYPAAAAWKLAGVARIAVPVKLLGNIASPIARAAMQAGAADAIAAGLRATPEALQVLGAKAAGASASRVMAWQGARSALQGGVAAWMLQGGDPAFKGHRDQQFAAGAGMGVLGEQVIAPLLGAAIKRFGPSLVKAANRVTSAFEPAPFAETKQGSGPFNQPGIPERPALPGRGIEQPGVPMRAMLPPGEGGPQIGTTIDPATGSPWAEPRHNVDRAIEHAMQGETPEEVANRLAVGIENHPEGPRLYQARVNAFQQAGNIAPMQEPEGNVAAAIQHAMLGSTPEEVAQRLAVGIEQHPAGPRLYQARVDAFLKQAQASQAAEADVVQANKAATVVQSPALAEVAGQAVIDEIAVAKAAAESTPAGVNVSQGIADPAKFLQEIAQPEGEVLYHYGSYRGGPYQELGQGADNLLGEGLYFTPTPDKLGHVAPSLVHAALRGTARAGETTQRFVLSPTARLFDMQAPVDYNLLKTFNRSMKLTDSFIESAVMRKARSGKLATYEDVVAAHQELGDGEAMNSVRAGINFAIGEAGYHGVRSVENGAPIVNIFPGSESLLTHTAAARHTAFASRPGTNRLDALLSDQPLHPGAVAEYETHGVFTGQKAMTAAGKTVRITKILANGVAQVQDAYGVSKYRVKINNLHPWLESPSTAEVPGLWEQFQGYADSRAAATAQTMQTPEIGAVRQQNLAHYMEDFMTEQGIHDPASRASISAHFNERYVADFKALAPAEHAAAEAAQADAAEHDSDIWCA